MYSLTQSLTQSRTHSHHDDHDDHDETDVLSFLWLDGRISIYIQAGMT